ncbi:MAG: hypothetical protein H7Y42_13855 [Chitinophagaceae bacterium]|nr:hypothetical protein [Chitinophagaceae bacterium]
MNYFKSLNLPILIDMLSDFKEHYKKMILTRSSKVDDIDWCKLSIDSIEKELINRDTELKRAQNLVLFFDALSD